MPWPRVEDDYFQHPKIRSLPYQAVLLDLAGIWFCARNLTDGLILAAELPALMPTLPSPKKWAAALLVGIRWETDPAGFRVHDYLVYNKTRTVILAERRAESDRKSKGKAGRNPAGRETSHTSTHTLQPEELDLGGSVPTLSPEGKSLSASGPSENGKQPHPARFDHEQHVLLGKILERRPKWLNALRPSGITLLNKDFGYAPVFEAMQELAMRLTEGTAGDVKEPFAYLRGMVTGDTTAAASPQRGG